MSRIRVLVCEDSMTVRRMLCDVISGHPDFEVVGEADNGKSAIEACQRLHPDVMTVDMSMPVMSGLAATEYIMAHCPTPILIVSASTNRGDLHRTYEALHAGAVDVLEKPRGDEPEGAWEAQLLSTLRLVSRIRVITHLRAKVSRARPPTAPRPVAATGSDQPRRIELLAIGASTGGPAAVVDILRSIPQLRLPMLLVIHLSARFGGAFADWLDAQSGHRVAFAVDGAPLASANGRVVMAPPDHHLVVDHGRLRLTHDAERHSCRPSIDVLFESLAREYGAVTAACLLTGMGRDGALGLAARRHVGGETIVQDEATSVVFGMGREAIALGAAARVLPLPEIGPALAALAAGGRT